MMRSYTGIDENKLLRAFLEEAEELLEKLNDSLLELEKDISNQALVHEIFRLTHSLKSEADLLGFSNLTEVAHRLEDVFEKIRNNDIVLTRPLMDLIFAGSDLIHEMIDRISRGESDSNIDAGPLLSDLKELYGKGREPAIQPSSIEIAGSNGLPETDTAIGASLQAELQLNHLQKVQLQEARDRGESLYRLRFQVDNNAEMKYARAYLVFNNLEMRTHVVKTLPELSDPTPDDSIYSRVTIFFTSDTEEQEILKACEVDQIHGLELTRLDYGSIAALRAWPEEPPLSHVHDLSVLPSGEELANSRKNRIEKASIRVETRKLNDIWNLVGELIICKAYLYQLRETFDEKLASGQLKGGLESVADTLEQISNEMQQAMMETRMVPIAMLFNKFPRLVRDLSRKLGKNVNLEIDGTETEIDRSIIEVLSDPLTHIIRNSLDHGIEPVEERLKAGKPEKGTVFISAHQQGGKIVIEISDDGRGLDVEKIRKKTEAGPDLSDEEVIKHIFSPGFSTKERVTDLSGRGVGMDVVATRIKEHLKGEVMVKSEKGRGTHIEILLPLTLTIVHSLVIRCRERHYAIPIRDIDETVKVADESIGNGSEGEWIRYADSQLRLLRLEALLHSETTASKEMEHSGVIIQQKGKRVCLLVDELEKEEDVVIKPIDELLNFRRLFSGVSILGDGRILFIVDTARIVEIT